MSLYARLGASLQSTSVDPESLAFRRGSLNSVRDLVEPSQDALMAGRTLLADSILEGYMQRQGDRLRVSTRLLDVASGRQLWNGHFDEPFTDIFTVQDAIADRVANALAPQLTPAERRRLHHRHTEDAEAYQLYVNGCFTGAG